VSGEVKTARRWRIGEHPIVAAPCRCEQTVYTRDENGDVRCVLCGRRHPLRVELEDLHIRQL